MKTNFKTILMAAIQAAGVAAAINAVLFFLFHAIGLISDEILLQPANQPMTVIPVIMASIVPTLLSAGVFYAMVRFTKNGYRYFMILALVLLAISFVNPFMIPEVTIPYVIALNVLHIVVVASILYFYKRAAGNVPAVA
jgi:hypothetical protein